MKKYLSLLLLAFPLTASAALKPGDFLTSGPTGTKTISLTFDDGPGPQTEEFLKLLDKYDVKATFFMLGEMVKIRPKVAKAVAAHGHELASHTYTHTHYGQRLRQLNGDVPATKKELLAEMKKTQSLIQTTTGQKVRFCRMPHGVDKPWIKEVAKDAGVVLVNWTYGADWTKEPQDKLIKEYVAALKPGAIILLHDGNPHREKSLAITEAILQAAQERGYRIVPLGKLLNYQ